MGSRVGDDELGAGEGIGYGIDVGIEWTSHRHRIDIAVHRWHHTSVSHHIAHAVGEGQHRIDIASHRMWS